jgi:crotonobetainyl-CoA:carnitine CoA-transferase CaiB-like acyl-CoA transferase
LQGLLSTRWRASFCSMMLADMGTEVIRIDSRRQSGTRGLTHARFDVLARGRRSLVLDLKKPQGREAALKLIEQADALIEGFRPGVMERLGLSPDIWPAVARRRPRGQVVDAAMVDGSALLASMKFGMLADGSWSPERGANFLDGGAHFYDTYTCADGKFVAVASIEPQFYQLLCDRIGIYDPAFKAQYDKAQWPELKRRLAAIFALRTRTRMPARSPATLISRKVSSRCQISSMRSSASSSSRSGASAYPRPASDRAALSIAMSRALAHK